MTTTTQRMASTRAPLGEKTNDMYRLILIALTVVSPIQILSLSAEAGWMEMGDAGELPGTAQVTKGMGPLDFISGMLSNPMGDRFDRDMYRIRVTGPFSATTVSGASFDTQLFLFNQVGFGRLANDDTSASIVQSTIPSTATMSLTPGLYNIAISKRNSDPISAGGLIFPDTPRTAVAGPTGPGGALPITAWTPGDPSDPPYTISFTGGVEFATVPEPSTLTLLSAASVGIIASCWLPRLRHHRRRSLPA